MKVLIVGNGKLANAILKDKNNFVDFELVSWSEFEKNENQPHIIVHTGSGRELTECLDYCRRTKSIFIELSTGLETENLETDFTLIVCPNISILLLKTLSVFDKLGTYFKNNKVTITESHQSNKKSIAGTAFSFAHSLEQSNQSIRSIRAKETQLNLIGIPVEYLDKHAYHKIEIQDGLDSVTIETKVLGHISYVNGLKKLLALVKNEKLEKRRYSVLELINLL